MTLALYILGPIALLSLLTALGLRSRDYRFRMKTALVASLACLLGLALAIEGSLRLKAGFESRDWPIVPVRSLNRGSKAPGLFTR